MTSFDNLLTIQDLGQLRTAAFNWSTCLTLPQVQLLASHAESLASAPRDFRLAIIHTYTSEPLDPWLNLAVALHNLKLRVYHAPYGLILQEAEAGSGLEKHEPDVTLILLRREDLHPELAKPLSGFDAAERAAIKQQAVQFARQIMSAFRARLSGHIVLTLLPSLYPPGLGIYDPQCERSENDWWAGFKFDIAKHLRTDIPASLFLDLDDVRDELGRQRFFDRRFWYSARFPFRAEAAAEVARRVAGIGALIKMPKAKVIVLDADNTLWGGVIGEDGIDGIALGPDYPGNAFVDFQRRLIDYRQRGFILALCSKNNSADVQQVLRQHPHQLLREESFAAKRVNWLPKTENLVSLADELNLGLESFVVVDDSAHECAAIRALLPQVETVQLPSRPVDIPDCLEKIGRLEVLSLTAEDLRKTELYSQELRRRELEQSSRDGGISLRDYLVSLKMRMRISFDDSSHASRLAQLTQKTNQFNLTTHRYNEQQMREFVSDAEYLVADFSLSDQFGDNGIVGLAVVHRNTAQTAELDTFLMSCRVIGRGAESAFLHALLRQLKDEGIDHVTASYFATARNSLAKNFLPNEGFQESAPGEYRRDLRHSPPACESGSPIEVELQNQSAKLQLQ